MVLEKLPTELLLHIGEFLTAKDTAVLRQVSRNVSAKVSDQGPFASGLRSKTRSVEFSPHSLQLLVEMTRPGRLGTALESLILVGVPLGRREAVTHPTTITTADAVLHGAGGQGDDDRAMMTALLAEAMRNLKANGEHRGLPSLSLTVDGSAVEDVRREWVCIWAAASQMFHVTLDALRHSDDLPIGALDLFTRPYCCSLSVANFWRDDLDDLLLRQCAPTICSVRRLHLSISRERNLFRERVWTVGQTALSVPIEPWAPREAGFARFLAAFRSVDDFKIHRYMIYHPDGQRQSAERDWFPQARARGALGNLARCSLRGLRVKGGDLLAFVQASPGLREVDMHGVTLDPTQDAEPAVGFRQVFDWLTVRAGSQLRELRLEDLQEKNRRVVFYHEPDDEVDDSHGWGRFRLTRRGETSARRPVPFGPVEEEINFEAYRLSIARDGLLYGHPRNRMVDGVKPAKDYY
ncbi:hypothetical protein SLS62_008487 [Diatrype stigma]|uniref:F-box domain-containing protein n=1 Tax=Diatrype stigma TaxID=117547 RepID=A0AAN9UKG2_9PEZI